MNAPATARHLSDLPEGPVRMTRRGKNLLAGLGIVLLLSALAWGGADPRADTLLSATRVDRSTGQAVSVTVDRAGHLVREMDGRVVERDLTPAELQSLTDSIDALHEHQMSPDADAPVVYEAWASGWQIVWAGSPASAQGPAASVQALTEVFLRSA